MAPEVRPLSKTVRDAVKRQKSPGRHIAPAAAALFHVLMFLDICGGVGVGGWWLWRMAMADPRFLMDGTTLGLGGSVKQCPESVAELRAIGQSFNGRSLLDPFLSSDIEAAYKKSIWVKRVVSMRRHFPNRVDLELQLRLPVAQVKCDRRYWLVDMEARLLPVKGSDIPFPKLPEIVGVTGSTIGRRPEAGAVWPDDGVGGALGVMRAFWASPLSGALPVARIVVNTGVFKAGDGHGKEIRHRFEVVSESGAVVNWGTFNQGEVEDELTSVEKMWHLQKLLEDSAALRPGVAFDVRTRLPGFTLLQ